MCVCVCVCIFLIANEAEHLFMYLFAICLSSLGFPCGSAGKESACHAGDLGLIPGLGRSPGEGKGYSGVENSRTVCIVHEVAINQTRLRDFCLLSFSI